MNEVSIPYSRVLVVANPIAGRGRAQPAAEELQRLLVEAGCEVELYLTRERGDAIRRVGGLGPGTDLVVAVGGDGTVAEVLSGLTDPVPLAVLPLGTANVLRNDLGLSRSPRELVDLLATGRVSLLDVARVWIGPERKERLSFLVTGVGFDGDAVRRVEEKRRGPITKWIYVRCILASFLSWRPRELRVEVDGSAVPGVWPWVLVSNVGGYGGIWRLSPQRQIDDGQFEVYLIPARGRLSLLTVALRGILRGLPSGAVELRLARRVRIDCAGEVAVEVDGDHAGTTPVEIEVLRGRQRLVVP